MDHRIVAVETGNMLGKGFLIGGLVPWFLWTRKHSGGIPVSEGGIPVSEEEGELRC